MYCHVRHQVGKCVKRKMYRRLYWQQPAGRCTPARPPSVYQEDVVCRSKMYDDRRQATIDEMLYDVDVRKIDHEMPVDVYHVKIKIRRLIDDAHYFVLRVPACIVVYLRLKMKIEN